MIARPLRPVPVGYVDARNGYHRLAYAVVAEARRVATTRFGLCATEGGFATPPFGDDEQVRVAPGMLVHQRGNTVESAPITSLRAAAVFLGIEPGTDAAEPDSPPLGDLDEDLCATVATGEFLASWFGFAWAVLEELRCGDDAVDADPTQLWPGHFDVATVIGDEVAGGRATFGASPGDALHSEPYLYIGPWGDVDADDRFWNETGFPGATLHHHELVVAKDPIAIALAFFRAGLARLGSAS